MLLYVSFERTGTSRRMLEKGNMVTIWNGMSWRFSIYLIWVYLKSSTIMGELTLLYIFLVRCSQYTLTGGIINHRMWIPANEKTIGNRPRNSVVGIPLLVISYLTIFWREVSTSWIVMKNPFDVRCNFFEREDLQLCQ
jgi:hypothetical protein